MPNPNPNCSHLSVRTSRPITNELCVVLCPSIYKFTESPPPHPSLITDDGGYGDEYDIHIWSEKYVVVRVQCRRTFALFLVSEGISLIFLNLPLLTIFFFIPCISLDLRKSHQLQEIQTNMETANLVILFAFCIGLPASILYIYLVITILFRRDYHTTFYGFFVVRAIPDLLFFLDSTLCFRLPTLGLFPNFYKWLSKPMVAVIFYGTPIFFHSDNLATMFMLLNRLTSIAWPIAHRQMWKVLFPACVLCIYGLPIVSISFIFNSNISAQVMEINGTTSISINPDPGLENEIYQNAASQDTFSAFVFMGISLCLNFGLLFAYIRTKKSNTRHHEMAAKAAKKRMLIYTVATFLGHALIAANFIIVLILSGLPDMAPLYFYFSTSTWIIDASCVALPSYLLLWASVKIRAQFLKDLAALLPCLPIPNPNGTTTPVQMLQQQSVGFYHTTTSSIAHAPLGGRNNTINSSKHTIRSI